MKIYHQNVFDKWPFDDGSMQAIITSPPYWGLRKYDIPDVVIGVAVPQDCEHEWGNIIIEKEDEAGFARNRKGLNKAAELLDGHVRTATTDIPVIKRESCFCLKCGAWNGQYGIEPSYKDYIEHTVQVKVLRDNSLTRGKERDIVATLMVRATHYLIRKDAKPVMFGKSMSNLLPKSTLLCGLRNSLNGCYYALLSPEMPSLTPLLVVGQRLLWQNALTG